MICFYQCLKLSPQFYNDIIAIIFKDDNGKICEGNNLNEQQISNVFSVYYNLKFCPAERECIVDKNALLLWVKEFEEGLKKNNQIRLFTYLLGHLMLHHLLGLMVIIQLKS
jgi:hypothetical protein